MEFILVSPSSQYFSVMRFNIYYYGIILAISIFIGFFVADKIAKKFYNINSIYDNSIFVICSGLICARLYYCIINYQIYFESPLRILNFREGGLSIHGTIIGGIISLIILSKINKLNFLKLCDIFSLILPLSQSIGRWGNFINSEAFGLPVNSFIKLYVAPSFRPLNYINFEYFHPTFLYESVLDILLFVILYKFIFKKYYERTGIVSGVYLLGYSLIRLFIEPLRIDCQTFLFNTPIPIIASLIMALIGLYLVKRGLSSK